jgi:membrane protein implicated in regulation of membrane protease activity
MVGFFAELGAWNWIVLGFLLLGLEVVVPGAFLLWIGIAAILTGALSLQLGGVAFWVWQVQILLFLVLSLVAVYAGRRIVAGSEAGTDEPLLNRRGEQLVGRTARLAEPITEGRGRIRIDDTVWRVSGPDLPAGARVRVVAAEDARLVVEAIQS